MRLARYSTGSAPAVIGVIVDGHVYALADLVSDAPQDMCDLIANWEHVKAAIAKIERFPEGLPLDKVTLRAPIPRPGKILALGLNYADHIEEAKDAGFTIPTEQVWFCKQPTSINDPNGDVELPIVSDKLDYEVELVAVIGKRGRHISREQAPAHVFGYTVGNDFTVRDWQWKTAQWMLGKSFDTHCPFGPAIVTADEIRDPHTLGLRSFVNAERRQNSNTRHFVFNVWDQIAELSQAMTLEVGDLIFTGTPGGVGFSFNPPKPLVVGDVVTCEIDGIGEIQNRIVAETSIL